MSEGFEIWWRDEGSGMAPIPGEDQEAHVHRIAEIAWSNGAFVANRKHEQETARKLRESAHYEQNQ